MRHTLRFTGPLALLLTACSMPAPARDEGVGALAGRDGSTLDTSPSLDASDATTSPDAAGACIVTITSPAQDTTYARGSLTVQATAQGCAVQELALRIDGQILANLPPPYQYSWDTSLTAEGSHRLVAEAVVAGVTFQSAPRTVVIDRTAPVLVHRMPAPSDGNTSVRDSIVAVFSEPIAPATITATTVSFAGASAGALPAALHLSTDGITLTAALDAAPTTPETVTATLTSGLTDLAGNAFVPDTAGPWSWVYPEWVSLGGEVRRFPTRSTASTPTLALDADDTPRVALLERDDLNAMAVVVERWDGSAWQPDGPVRVRLATSDTQTPVFARTSSGESVLTWTADDGNAPAVFTTRTAAGGADENLDPALSHVAFSTPAAAPSLRVTPAGDPIVAWHESVASARGVYVAAWTGTAWSEFGAGPDVRGGATPSGFPSLALTRSGAPVVAFSEVDASTSAGDIFVSRWNGTAWVVAGGALSIAGGDTWAASPSLALTRTDAPVVAWVEPLAAGADNSVAVRRVDGSSWTSLGRPFSADTAARTPAHNPVLVLDATDAPLVAFCEGPRVYVFRYEGNTWRPLSAGLNEPSMNPAQVNHVSLVLDSRGTPMVAWEQMQMATGRPSVFVRRYNR